MTSRRSSLARAHRCSIGAVPYAAVGSNVNAQLGVLYRSAGAIRAPVAGFAGYEVAEFGLGYFDTLFRTTDGLIRALGANELGEGGNGKRQEMILPTLVHGITGATSLATGGAHSAAILRRNGALVGWGPDAEGQLGDGEQAGTGPHVKDLPVAIPAPGPAEAVFAGGGSLVVKIAGQWYGCGENKSGELGDGTTHAKYRLTLLPWPADVVKVVIGSVSSWGGHTVLITASGQPYVMGDNGAGQLGLGFAGKPITTPTLLKGVEGIVDGAASVSHTILLREDGVPLVMGSGQYGELGQGPAQVANKLTPTPVLLDAACTAVCAPFRVSHFIVDGESFACGWGNHGAHGLGNQEVVTTPTLVKGLSGVKRAWAGEYHAIFEGVAPPAPFSVVPKSKALEVRWQTETTDKIKLQIRPRGMKEWGPVVGGKHLLPAGAGEYEFENLTAGVEYEVHIANKGTGLLVGAGIPSQ